LDSRSKTTYVETGQTVSRTSEDLHIRRYCSSTCNWKNVIFSPKIYFFQNLSVYMMDHVRIRPEGSVMSDTQNKGREKKVDLGSFKRCLTSHVRHLFSRSPRLINQHPTSSCLVVLYFGTLVAWSTSKLFHKK
jgi:hypothetical protein